MNSHGSSGNNTSKYGKMKESSDNRKSPERPDSVSRESFYRQTLSDILTFSTRLTRNVDLTSLYRESTHLAQKILDLDFSTLMILSDDNRSLIIRDAIGFSESMINTFSLLEGQGLSTYVVTEKKAAVVEDFRVEKRFEVPPVVFQEGITSALSVPMMIGDKVFGVMIGHTRGRRVFTSEEIDLYLSIANQSAVAIKNVMHFESMQDSEKRFRALIDGAGDAVFLSDMEGQLVDVNSMACQSLGYSREELLRMSVFDVDPQARDLDTREKLWSNLAPAEHKTILSHHRRKDGTVFPVEIRIGLLPLHDRNYILGFARDISERQKAENEKQDLMRQLTQAQKMESVGTLAGGIAHDFNNILTPVFGYLQLAMLKAEDDSELQSDLGEVMKAAKRAGELVKQILAFSRSESGDHYPFQVHVVVKEVLQLLRASIPRSIEMKTDIDTHCGLVLADPTQIHQILMNLCTNAYHAMRDPGGVLHVSLIPLKIADGDRPENSNLEPGPYLKLEVSDTGHGIDPRLQERIFEPYFTTKVTGEGTGMGLSVVHGIVTAIGGHIEVRSEPGRGSTFRVYLPVISESRLEKGTLPEGHIPRGDETIILVDDEESVVEVEMAMLTRLGYNVQTFTAPLEALERFRADPDKYDLVITDMTMPKISGDALAREILALRADMPVILCTGFSDLIDEESAKSMGIRAYVTKPVIMRSFGQTVRDVLDQKTK